MEHTRIRSPRLRRMPRISATGLIVFVILALLHPRPAFADTALRAPPLSSRDLQSSNLSSSSSSPSSPSSPSSSQPSSKSSSSSFFSTLFAAASSSSASGATYTLQYASVFRFQQEGACTVDAITSWTTATLSEEWAPLAVGSANMDGRVNSDASILHLRCTGVCSHSSPDVRVNFITSLPLPIPGPTAVYTHDVFATRLLSPSCYAEFVREDPASSSSLTSLSAPAVVGITVSCLVVFIVIVVVVARRARRRQPGQSVFGRCGCCSKNEFKGEMEDDRWHTYDTTVGGNSSAAADGDGHVDQGLGARYLGSFNHTINAHGDMDTGLGKKTGSRRSAGGFSDFGASDDTGARGGNAAPMFFGGSSWGGSGQSSKWGSHSEDVASYRGAKGDGPRASRAFTSDPNNTDNANLLGFGGGAVGGGGGGGVGSSGVTINSFNSSRDSFGSYQGFTIGSQGSRGRLHSRSEEEDGERAPLLPRIRRNNQDDDVV